MKNSVLHKTQPDADRVLIAAILFLLLGSGTAPGVFAQSSIHEKQLEQSAAQLILEPVNEAMARSKRMVDRMNDPNAGKRPGDEKLGCDEIKRQLEASIARYEVQSAKYDTAVDEKNASTERYAQEMAGIGGQIKQLGLGLGSVTARLLGGKVAGEAVARAATDSYLQAHGQQAKEANDLANEGEKLKLESDRGHALMRLGKTKSCTGLPSGPSTPVKATQRN